MISSLVVAAAGDGDDDAHGHSFVAVAAGPVAGSDRHDLDDASPFHCDAGDADDNVDPPFPHHVHHLLRLDNHNDHVHVPVLCLVLS